MLAARMNVLITSNSLNGRAGVQSTVRDLAGALQKAGHTVMAFTSDTRVGERMLEIDAIPIATDLARLPLRPDIIHGQHHLDVMTALTALPGVPAIYHCHGATWKDAIIRHPRVCRYVVMSETLARRISIESGIPPSQIEVLPNGVDTGRFKPTRPLPSKPKRALIYHGRISPESPVVIAIHEACARSGIELECVGYPFGRMIDDPHEFLPGFDLVFASGLSAIEAMASGCATVVLGLSASGPLVKKENFDRLRRMNFSIAANENPRGADEIIAELKNFHPEEAAAVSAMIRAESDISANTGRLVSLYQNVIREHQSAPPDMEAESLAISRYLQHIVPLIKAADETLGRPWSIPQGFNPAWLPGEDFTFSFKQTA
jgi:hypothetical protein